MSETEWLTCVDPGPMLEFLNGKASSRKLWLFACGSCRRHSMLMADARCRAVVDIGERYADGQAKSDELSEASEEAFCRRNDLNEISQTAAIAAAFAVVDPSERDPNLGGMTTVEAVQLSSSDLMNLAKFSDSAVAECSAQCHFLRDIFGNPFRPVAVNPAWLSPKVTSLAQTIYADRAFEKMPALADALQKAGCDNQDIVSHCRGPGPHVKGCWVVDLLLGKE